MFGCFLLFWQSCIFCVLPLVIFSPCLLIWFGWAVSSFSGVSSSSGCRLCLYLCSYISLSFLYSLPWCLLHSLFGFFKKNFYLNSYIMILYELLSCSLLLPLNWCSEIIHLIPSGPPVFRDDSFVPSLVVKHSPLSPSLFTTPSRRPFTSKHVPKQKAEER